MNDATAKAANTAGAPAHTSGRGYLKFMCCDCRKLAHSTLESVPEPPRCDACHLEAVAALAQGQAVLLMLAALK